MYGQNMECPKCCHDSLGALPRNWVARFFAKPVCRDLDIAGWESAGGWGGAECGCDDPAHAHQ